MFRTALSVVVLAASLVAGCGTPAACEPDFGLTEGCETIDSDTDTDAVETDSAHTDTDAVETDSAHTDTIDPVVVFETDTGIVPVIDTDLPVESDSDTDTDVVHTDTGTPAIDTDACIPGIGQTANCPDTGDTDQVDTEESDVIDTEETETEIDTPEETDDTAPPDTIDTSETGDTATDSADTDTEESDTPAETDQVDSDAPDTDVTDTDDTTETEIDPNTVDDDLDGYSELQGDCEDANPNMYPEERVEYMDWANNDCDGQTDEGCDTSCGYDYESQRPGLGYCRDDLYAFWLSGDPEHECVGHVWYVQLDLDHDGYTSDVDCRDWVATIHPGAYDYGNDGVDQNCDGIDQDSGYTLDNDGDGYCEAPTCTDGSLPGDCADWIQSIHPGAYDWGGDGTDQDCDGDDLDQTWETDNDLDGVTEYQGDCNDADIDVYPGAPERMNWASDDCDAQVDEGCDVSCNWDYVSRAPDGTQCRDDLYEFWLADQTGEGDLTWECVGHAWRE